MEVLCAVGMRLSNWQALLLGTNSELTFLLDSIER